MDEHLRAVLMEEAAKLRMSGDRDLEVKGLILEVATSRNDIPAVKKVLGELEKIAKDEGEDAVADAYGYFRQALKEESKPAPVEEVVPNA